jgi:hypothetical protein
MKDFVIWMVTIIITNLATGMMMYMIGKREAIEEVSNVLDGLIDMLKDGKEHSDGTEET